MSTVRIEDLKVSDLAKKDVIVIEKSSAICDAVQVEIVDCLLIVLETV